MVTLADVWVLGSYSDIIPHFYFSHLWVHSGFTTDTSLRIQVETKQTETHEDMKAAHHNSAICLSLHQPEFLHGLITDSGVSTS